MPRTDAPDYYVSLVRGARTSLLAGPFATHTEALDFVDRAAAIAEKIDPRAHFDAHGTLSLPRSKFNPPGILNRQLEVTPREWMEEGFGYENSRSDI